MFVFNDPEICAYSEKTMYPPMRILKFLHRLLEGFVNHSGSKSWRKPEQAPWAALDLLLYHLLLLCTMNMSGLSSFRSYTLVMAIQALLIINARLLKGAGARMMGVTWREHAIPIESPILAIWPVLHSCIAKAMHSSSPCTSDSLKTGLEGHALLLS